MTRREYLRSFQFAFQRRWILAAERLLRWRLGRCERADDRQLAADARRGLQ